jgi:hypothetical protein
MLETWRRDAAHKRIEGTTIIEGEAWMLKRIDAIERELKRMKIECHSWAKKPRSRMDDNDSVVVHGKYKVIPFVGIYKYDGHNMFTSYAKLSLQMWMPTKDFKSTQLVYLCGHDGKNTHIDFAHGNEAVRITFAGHRMQSKSKLLIALTEAIGRI